MDQNMLRLAWPFWLKGDWHIHVENSIRHTVQYTILGDKMQFIKKGKQIIQQ